MGIVALEKDETLAAGTGLLAAVGLLAVGVLVPLALGEG